MLDVMTKTCGLCEEEKSIDDFYKKRDGKDSLCKVCRKKKNIESYHRHRDKRIKSISERYHQNKAEINLKKRADRKENPDKYKWYDIKKLYGLSKDEYEEIIQAQGGRCPGCGRDFSDKVRPAVDHDHSCCPQKTKTCGSCVRGILCRGCNTALGYAGDSIEVLAGLIEYLENTKKEEC